MCSPSTNEPYDCEAAAYFVAQRLGGSEIAQLDQLVRALPITLASEDVSNPFCRASAAKYGSADEILAYLTTMLERPFYTSVFAGEKQFMRHAVGPHPPSNDGIEITTIIQSQEQSGKICLLSIVKRIAVAEWVVFDNHHA